MPPLTQAGPGQNPLGAQPPSLGSHSPSPLLGPSRMLLGSPSAGGGQERWKGDGQRNDWPGRLLERSLASLTQLSAPGSLSQLGGACAPGRCWLGVTESISAAWSAQQSGARGEGTLGPRGPAAQEGKQRARALPSARAPRPPKPRRAQSAPGVLQGGGPVPQCAQARAGLGSDRSSALGGHWLASQVGRSQAGGLGPGVRDCRVTRPRGARRPPGSAAPLRGSCPAVRLRGRRRRRGAGAEGVWAESAGPCGAGLGVSPGCGGPRERGASFLRNTTN